MITTEKREWVRRFSELYATGKPDELPANLGTAEDGSPGESNAGSDPAPPVQGSTCDTDLPQPMLPDCQIVRGVVPAPDNFVLCKMHGHVLDTDKKLIVANNLKEFEAQHPEYGTLPMPMSADCAPEPGKVPGPVHHMLCRTHGHVLDIKTKQVIAYTIKDYVKRFPAKKPSPAATPKVVAPPFDKKHARETLRDMLGGTSILIGEFQSQRGEFNSSLAMLASGPCGPAVAEVRKAMADTDAPMHAQNRAAGEYIAEFDVAAPTAIPKASQDAIDAMKRFSLAMNKLQTCLEHPPPQPPPGPAPDGVDEAAWKAQQELVRRRDSLLSQREFSAHLRLLRELGEKIQGELETAHDVAKAVLAG